MPARKPTGAATSTETRISGSQSQSGCQLPHQRMTSAMPRPIPKKSAVIHAARIQPAWKSSRNAVPRGRLGGAACVWWSAVVDVTASSSPLLAGLDQILDERVELVLRQARERRHHVLRVARLRVRIRVDDRRPDECLERLLRLGRVLRQLVEVGADLGGRAGGGERVAGP